MCVCVCRSSNFSLNFSMFAYLIFDHVNYNFLFNQRYQDGFFFSSLNKIVLSKRILLIIIYKQTL